MKRFLNILMWIFAAVGLIGSAVAFYLFVIVKVSPHASEIDVEHLVEHHKQITINDDWLFTLGDMSSPYFAEKCDTKSWKSLNVPHDWSIEEGYRLESTAGSNAFLPGGVGWYRKEFELPKGWRKDGIAVRFEGVYNNSDVWINGHHLGFFPNGYLDFEYDLTPYINTKGTNTIAVRVDRRAYADARWYVGAGIYRPVHLISREEVYIPSHGQKITTPKITYDESTVAVETEYTNRSEREQKITIKYEIADGIYRKTSSKSELVIPAGESVTDKTTLTLGAEPRLWSLKNPQLYDLYTTVECGGDVVDVKMDKFGLRTAEFRPDSGFFLNGENVKIKGVNLHHDLGAVGVALYDDVLRDRLEKLQKMGVNAIRTAHNPHSESLLEMCDRMGLLVMDEFTDEWLVLKDKWIIQRSKHNIPDSLESGYPNYFKEFAERDLKNFLRRDQNHPSIILWSIGNEIEWTYSYYFASSLDRKGYKGLVFTGEPEKNRELTRKRFAELSKGNDPLSQTAHKLAGWVKEIDTTRPITSGVVIPSVSRISGYVDALDVVGYNYKDSYYANDHTMYPEKAIYGSENVGQFFEWEAVADKDYISGIFLWTGVDYLGENGPWPSKGGHYSLFDFAGFQSPRGHFFETLWSDKPKTYMVTTPASMSEFKQRGDGGFDVVLRKDPLRRWLWYETFDKWNYAEGEQVVVQVYSNAPKVELFVNGVSQGVRNHSMLPEENVIVWQVPYTKGEIVAVGRKIDGQETSRYTLRTAEATSKLAVKKTGSISCKGFARVELSLEDRGGTRVVDKPELVTATFGSELAIAGVDNGSDQFVGNHQATSVETHNGRALFLFKTTRKIEKGEKVEVTLSTGRGVKTTIDLN
ncbi:MAG: sugar-binding domain-containing protein [Rikenellaceae bacterium]